MFNIFDDLMIDEEYNVGIEGYLTDDDYFESIEEDTIAIESLAYDIAMEAKKPNKQPGKMRSMLANLARSLSSKCHKHEHKCRSNNHDKLANLWRGLANWFDKAYKMLAKVKAYGMHTDEIDATWKAMDEKKKQVLMLEQKEANDIKGIEEKGSGGPAKIEGRGVAGRIGMKPDTIKSAGGKNKPTGNPVDTPNVIAVGGPNGNASPNVKTMSMSDRLKANHYRTSAIKAGKSGDMDKYNKWNGKFQKILNKYGMSAADFKVGKVNEGFINYDPDLDCAIESFIGTEAYAETLHADDVYVVVEGLLSKPKTQEQMLAKMQKRVNRLKTVGQCDDMLRQLSAESSKFNSAISALKRASADYSQTNDKKALRKSAGPILKELNKTCKILKIKSIADDPKNISQEEIKKLHDFITGAKQLITARKKVLSGAASEGFVSGYDDDFEYAAEGYEDDDFLSLIQDEYDGYDNVYIADEALIEDFAEADQNIAIATEGIIDPDAKRALRIQFGEKRRQIKSVVKKARAAKKAKDFATAIAMYQEAKKGYQSLLAEAKKLPDRAIRQTNASGDVIGNGKASSSHKVGLINWCIQKMGECDNAIEAIKNGQMRRERKAAEKEARAARKAAKRGGASESYLDDALEYEAVIESMYDDDDDEYDYDFDMDDDDYDTEGGLESLLL